MKCLMLSLQASFWASRCGLSRWLTERWNTSLSRGSYWWGCSRCLFFPCWFQVSSQVFLLLFLFCCISNHIRISMLKIPVCSQLGFIFSIPPIHHPSTPTPLQIVIKWKREEKSSHDTIWRTLERILMGQDAWGPISVSGAQNLFRLFFFAWHRLRHSPG